MGWGSFCPEDRGVLYHIARTRCNPQKNRSPDGREHAGRSPVKCNLGGLNATLGDYRAFNPPIVAFTLSGDQNPIPRQDRGYIRKSCKHVTTENGRNGRDAPRRVRTVVERVVTRSGVFLPQRTQRPQREGRTSSRPFSAWICPPARQATPDIRQLPLGRDEARPSPETSCMGGRVSPRAA